MSKIIDAVNQTKQDMKGNSMKEEALELANDIDNCPYFDKGTGNMIRRLVEELDNWQFTAQHWEFMSRNFKTIVEEKQAIIDRLNLELGNPIDHEEWGKHQVACKHDVDDGACKECYEEATQTKPLSDADIMQISYRYHYTYNPDYVGFARAIEKEHGIK